jgi:ABC-type nitrate/sulfonate/bicarbonate transport system substrate-binding protein
MARYVIQPHARLQEWIAEENGHFTDVGLDYEFQAEGYASSSATTSTVRSADSVPAELRRGAFEDMTAGRTCDVSSACHWAVNAAAAGGAGRMWANAYSVTPSGIFVAADSPYVRPEDLAGVPVAVSYHSGSHYAAVQGLEPFVGADGCVLSYSGLPTDRARLLIRGEVPAVNVFGPQYYVLEQLGYRKLVDTTFMIGFLVREWAEPDDTAKYFRALALAQRDLDLAPERYKQYWLRELSADLAELVDVRRFGPGERIVFAPYTREMYERTQAWMRGAHRLLDLDGVPEAAFGDVVLTSG